MAALLLLVMLGQYLAIDGLRSNFFETRELSSLSFRSTGMSSFILNCGLMCLSRPKCKEFYHDESVRRCDVDRAKFPKSSTGIQHWIVEILPSTNNGRGEDGPFNDGQSILLAPTFSYNPVLQAIENHAFHETNINVTDRISTLTYVFATETLFIAKSLPLQILAYVKREKYGTIIVKTCVRQFANDEGANFIAYVKAVQINAIAAMDNDGKNHRTVFQSSSNLFALALDPRRRLMYVLRDDSIIRVTYEGEQISKIRKVDDNAKMCYNANLETLFFTAGMNLFTMNNGTIRKMLKFAYKRTKVVDILCHQEKVLFTFKTNNVIAVVENGHASTFATADKPLSYGITRFRSVT